MQYKRKVKFLKGVVDAEKFKTPSEKLMATQILSPTNSNDQELGTKNKSREIYLQSQSKHSGAIRDELFNGSTTDGLRQRKTVKPGTESEDVDLVLKYHHDMQEKVAQEMVSLAHNLKENCVLANQIIRKDVEVSYCNTRLKLFQWGL